ncbi:MAG: Lrp/AsnC family transcriptional regulator, partial [Pseudomonadota bacterium]
LDGTDIRLLSALQDDATLRLDALAERAGISTATAQRRVRRLRETGVIRGTVALLDGARLGHPLTAIIMVELEREQTHHLDAFAARARADAQVQQCYYVTGEADFCLICVVPDMPALQRLAERMFHSDPNVRRFRTSTVLSTRKLGLTVPLP